MQLALVTIWPPGGAICIGYKFDHQMAPLALVANLATKWRNLNRDRCPNLVGTFAIDTCGAIWWPNLELMQVATSGGQIWNLCKWRHLVAKYATNASSAT